jgi:ketosteroid isomerase-like protein
MEGTRRFVHTFNARDIEGMIALFDPNIEFHSTFAAVGGGVYHGHDGMRGWHRDLQEAWGQEIRADPDAYVDLGEQTLIFFVMRARGQASGAEVANPNATLLRWRDGLCVYLKAYAQRQDALRDLGVTEDDLEPIAP